HRLAERGEDALRDAVLVAPVVGDDVSPAAPGPLDGRLPAAWPAHVRGRVPAGGLDDAPVHGVPAAAVAGVAPWHNVPPWDVVHAPAAPCRRVNEAGPRGGRKGV